MWQSVGIPETEARVYETLIPRGQSTVADLSDRANLTPATTRSALAGLTRRGLVSRVPGRPARYSAAEPSLAGSVLIAKREQELSKLQRHLNALDDTYRTEASRGTHAGYAELIEGASKVWRAFVRVQRSARQEVRAFDKPPYFVPPGEHGDEGPNPDEREALDEGAVGYRVIYDKEAVALPGRLENIWEGIHQGEQARIGTGLPVKLVIADSRVAIMSSGADYREETAYLIHPSSLLDMAMGLFESLWERAVPLNRPATMTNDDVSHDRDHQLLGLLASGATDAVIAKRFGWSVRTVQRHVRRLMDTVGAGTRFQAGMEAVRRGWL